MLAKCADSLKPDDRFSKCRGASPLFRGVRAARLSPIHNRNAVGAYSAAGSPGLECPLEEH